MAGENKELDAINEALQKGMREEHLLPRGMKLYGTIVSAKRKKTVTVERQLAKKIGKYKRMALVRSKVSAHVPGQVNLKEGMLVEIQQTRKISKTKSWVVTKVLSLEGGKA